MFGSWEFPWTAEQFETGAIIHRFHSEVNLWNSTLLMFVARTPQLFFTIDAAKETMVTVKSFGWSGELDDIFTNRVLTVGIHYVQHLREISTAQGRLHRFEPRLLR